MRAIFVLQSMTVIMAAAICIPHRADADYTASDLARRPFACAIGGATIRVEGLDTVDGKGPCGMFYGESIRVLVNGKVVPVPPDLPGAARQHAGPKSQWGWMEFTHCSGSRRPWITASFENEEHDLGKAEPNQVKLWSVRVCPWRQPSETADKTPSFRCRIWDRSALRALE